MRKAIERDEGGPRDPGACSVPRRRGDVAVDSIREGRVRLHTLRATSTMASTRPHHLRPDGSEGLDLQGRGADQPGWPRGAAGCVAGAASSVARSARVSRSAVAVPLRVGAGERAEDMLIPRRVKHRKQHVRTGRQCYEVEPRVVR